VLFIISLRIKISRKLTCQVSIYVWDCQKKKSDEWMTIEAFRVLFFTFFFSFHLTFLTFLSEFWFCILFDAFQLSIARQRGNTHLTLNTSFFLSVVSCLCLSLCTFTICLSVFLWMFSYLFLSLLLFFLLFALFLTVTMNVYYLPLLSLLPLLWFSFTLFPLSFDCFCNSLGMIFLTVCLFILLLFVSIYSLFVY
jgi:hypothetical protein